MRILLVNSNTSTAVTSVIEKVARAAASPTSTIVCRTAAFGPVYISSRAEAAVAAYGTMDAIAAHADSVDAAVIAAFVDPGLLACREVFGFPVVGVAEAAMVTADFIGARYAIVTTGPRVVPVFEDLAKSYGRAGNLVAVRAIAESGIDAIARPDEAAAALASVAMRCVTENLAEVVILGGAPLAGLRDAVQALVPVPVLDGVSCSVRLAEALGGLRLSKPTAGSLAHPGLRTVTGVTSAVARLFEKSGPT